MWKYIWLIALMIMLKMGLCCSFIFPAMSLDKSKLINFFHYTLMIPLLMCLFLMTSTSNPNHYHSYSMMLMSLVISLWTPTIYAAFQRSYSNKFSINALSLSLLMVLLFMVFSSQSLLTLFIFFEMSLMPIMFILFMGGSSNKKLEAGLYMFAFTSSSAFVFLAFLVMSSLLQHGTYHFMLISTSSHNSPLDMTSSYSSFSMVIYNLATVVMLIKTPLFFLHMWLPKAHVEAPVFGSMVLASLLLKTGGYGYLVLFMVCFGVLGQYDFSVCVILLLAILAAVSCSAQMDIKMLIAYSSVNHMGVMVCGIVLGLSSSTLGSVVLMIGHGIISSVLFYLASGSYSQMMTRSSFFSMLLGKSNVNMIFWLVLVLINAGLPPFLMFMGESLILKATLMYPLLMFLFLINYMLIGYYSCLMLLKLMLSKFPSNVGSLMGNGIPSYMSNTVVFMHLSVLVNMTICFPWLS